MENHLKHQRKRQRESLTITKRVAARARGVRRWRGLYAYKHATYPVLPYHRRLETCVRE